MTGAGERRRLMTFGVVWSGQLVSIVGSALTTFALGLWVYRTRGSVTDFALVGFWAVVPRIAMSPIAGVLVDSVGRRRIMLLAATAGACMTAAIAALVVQDRLAIWHVYLAAAVGGGIASFEWPAWMAATTTLVPPRHLGRASGLVSFAQAASDIAGPILAALLLVRVGILAILAVDLASFLYAGAALALVRFPEPAVGSARNLQLHDLLAGLRYVGGDASLRSLVVFLASVTFQWGVVAALLAPMVLGISTPVGLGQVISVAGIGAVAGAVFVMVSGGGSRRVRSLVLAEATSGLAFVGMGLGRDVAIVAMAAFVAHVTIPVIAASTQVIWQELVPLSLQGRVFAARQMIERLPAPLAYLVAGPLAERVFDPAVSSGPLASTLQRGFGSGETRGIGVLFAVLGVAQVVIALTGLASVRLREADPGMATGDRATTAPDSAVSPGAPLA